MKENIEELIELNKNLIYKIASRYSYYYNMEDLFQVGVIGLIKAYRNYNIRTKAQFSTYAYKYILGEIIEFIKNDRNIIVNSDMMKIYKSYEKSKEYLTSELGKEPNFEEISKFMNIKSEYLENVIQLCAFTVSLDSPMDEEGFSLEKVVGSDNTRTLDDLIDLKRELERLTEEERKIIELRYFKDYTQMETAMALGMSQVQISRNENLILKKINQRIVA